MHCTQCSHVVSANDKFCAKCGHPVSGARETPQVVARSSGNAESAKIHLSWLEDLRGKARRRIFVLRVFTAVAILGWPLYSLVVEHAALADVGEYLLGTAFVSSILHMNLAQSLEVWFLHPEDYYGLPGAKTEMGEHRCVHCGHNNYYVKGEYGSSRRHHSCPRCNNYLFTVSG